MKSLRLLTLFSSVKNICLVLGLQIILLGQAKKNLSPSIIKQQTLIRRISSHLGPRPKNKVLRYPKGNNLTGFLLNLEQQVNLLLIIDLEQKNRLQKIFENNPNAIIYELIKGSLAPNPHFAPKKAIIFRPRGVAKNKFRYFLIVCLLVALSQPLKHWLKIMLEGSEQNRPSEGQIPRRDNE